MVYSYCQLNPSQIVQRLFKSDIPTTVMTGNTTQLTIDLVQFLSAKFSAPSDAKLEAAEALERMSRFISVIIGFTLGGFAAVFFILVPESWWSLTFPLVIISILAIAAYVEHARQSSAV